MAFLLNMVREGGVEPPHQRYWYLKPARLPIPPPSHEIKIKEQPSPSTFQLKSRASDAARTMPTPISKINALSSLRSQRAVHQYDVYHKPL